MKKIIVCLFGLFLSLTIVNAECSDAEKARLRKEAAQVKLDYQEAEGVEDKKNYTIVPEMGDVENYELKYDYFKIILSNVTDDLYVIIKNDYDDDEKQINFSLTKGGVYTYDWYNVRDIVKFSYEVYASSKTSCVAEKLAVNYLTTPKYNDLSDRIICQDIADFSACQKYIKEDVSEEVLTERIEDYIKEKEEKASNKKWYEDIIEKVKEHKILVIGCTIMVIGAGVALVNVKRKRRAI